MKNFLVTAFLALLGASGVSGALNTDSIIRELDHIVERRDTWYAHQAWRIDSLKKLTAAIPSDDYSRRADRYHELFTGYKAFQSDSAQAYARRELDMALRMADADAIVRARSDELFSYIAAGNFTAAVDVVRQTDLSRASDRRRGEFYFLCIRLFSDISCFVDGTFTDANAARSRAYSDSVLTIMDPASYEGRYAGIYTTLADLTYSERIAMFSGILRESDISPGEQAMISSMLADNYRDNHDDEGFVYYKALSAILDIRSGKRETTAIRELAKYMIEHGDHSRAFTYINVALDDANFFNAPHRKAEISNILPLIEAVRYNSVESDRTVLARLLALMLVLSAGLVWAIVYARKANRAVRRRKKELEAAVEKLNESNRIKEEYIGYGFRVNSHAMHKIEDIHKMVHRKLKARMYDDLDRSLNDADLRAERARALREFDAIFLKLFPGFPAKYAALFPEGEALPPEGELTPEMRIFALIRLGVSDIESIARLLDYSTNTVSTYKTRAKKRSILPNDRFEAAILAIS